MLWAVKALEQFVITHFFAPHWLAGSSCFKSSHLD